MSVTVKLPAFEGPLDLLLHLIEKNQVDICDIPIYEITKQYLEYLDEWNHENMIIASEFIVMAATLIKIKARMLIPSEPKEEDEEDPREDLIRRLLEYKRFKEAAQEMKKRIPAADRFWITRGREKLKIPAPKPSIEQLLKGLSLDDIYALYKQALQNKADSIDPTRSTFNSVAKDSYTIDSKIRDLLDTLEHLQTISFYQLREQSHSRQEEITYFLAMLELNRSSLVYLKQENPFEDILMVPADKESENADDVAKPTESEDLPETEEEKTETSEIIAETEEEKPEVPADTAELISETTESPADPVEPEHEITETDAMTVPIPTITIEPSISIVPVTDTFEEVMEVTEAAEEPEVISAEEVTSSVDEAEVITTEEVTEAAEEPEVIAAEEVTEATEEPEVITAEGATEAAEEPEVIATEEVTEAVEEPEVIAAEEVTEAVEETEESEDFSSASNVIAVDFSQTSENDPSDWDKDGSEYTERIMEDERGYSDPKKARAAGA